MSDLSSSWEKLRNGAALSDAEIDNMIAEIESALPYLSDYGPKYSLVYLDARQNLETLKQFQARRTESRKARK
jgi:hypothetical protein